MFFAVGLAALWMTAAADKIDDHIAKVMADKSILGLQIGIYENGKPVKLKGYGQTSAEGSRQVDENTLFNIGSVTKQFTATAVMMLSEEGKLRTDESIRKYLPELPEVFDAVRIAHVLSHTSGLGDYGSVPGFDFHGQPTEAEFLAGMAKTKLDFEPGTKYQYSNIGYCLLGVLIQRLGGKPYEDFVVERIFQKLGMVATRFIQPGPWPKEAATGYAINGDIKRPGRTERAKLAAPSGAILTNVIDMAKWDASMRNHSLLKDESLRLMWKPTLLSGGAVSNYGFGWNVLKTAAGSFVLHTGATVAGFRSAIVRQLDGPLSAFVSINVASDLSLTGLLNDVVKIWKAEHQEESRLRSWIKANWTLR